MVAQFKIKMVAAGYHKTSRYLTTGIEEIRKKFHWLVTKYREKLNIFPEKFMFVIEIIMTKCA
jgi:hypothetical protein